METSADPAERIVPAEVKPALARQRPVQAGGPVEGQGGMALGQLGPREGQGFVQFIQRLEGIVQPENPAVPQAVVPLFLVEG